MPQARSTSTVLKSTVHPLPLLYVYAQFASVRPEIYTWVVVRCARGVRAKATGSRQRGCAHAGTGVRRGLETATRAAAENSNYNIES
jgi:hypothetical protein